MKVCPKCQWENCCCAILERPRLEVRPVRQQFWQMYGGSITNNSSKGIDLAKMDFAELERKKENEKER